MHLDAQQFAEIVSSLDRNMIDRQSDQRRSNRAIHRREISVTQVAGDAPSEPITVAMVDFSTRGIGILHARQLTRGEQFVTRLAREGKPAVELLCTVAHCRNMSNGMFKIGAEFTCTISQPANPTSDAEDEAKRIRQSVLR